MYIIAIAWIYVAFMMAITSETIVSGIFVFLGYGLIPCALVMYILRAPGRAKRRLANERTQWTQLDKDQNLSETQNSSESASPDLPIK